MNVTTFLEPVFKLIGLGGPVVVLLLAISVFALALIVIKALQFMRLHVGRHGDLEDAVAVWRQGRTQEAIAMAQSNKSPAAMAVSTALAFSAADVMQQSEIEEEISRAATRQLHELQKGFRALDAIVQIAPLLGLFGTVLGMIAAFQALQAAGNAVDPSALAGGIWVALMTTAVGLAVAMPVSLVLTFFESRVENERVAIETLTGAVLSKKMAQTAASPLTESSAMGTPHEALA